MRTISLFILLLFSLVVSGQRNYYSKEADKEAIKSAYRILKAFYPDYLLCVSDSIFDLEWWGYRESIDAETSDKLYKFRMDKNWTYDKPVYQKGLSKMLKADSRTEDEICFYADFSQPYKGMIRCDIMPLDRCIGIRGTPTIDTFLFRYDNDGSIYQVTKESVNID